MDFISILKTIFNESDQKVIRDSKNLSSTVRTYIQTEEDIVQFAQFKFLLEVGYNNFVYEIFCGHSLDDNLMMRLDEVVTKFDAEKIAPQIYSYFIYVVLQALGVKTERQVWANPFDNKLEQDPSKTFGVGFFQENLKDYEILNNMMKKSSNKRSYVTIPHGVTGVDDRVLYSDSKMQFITIPRSLVNLPSNMLSNCVNLKTVLMSSDVKVVPQNFCSNNSNLSLVIGMGLKEIKARAFMGTSVSSIAFLGQANLEIIGSEAFKDCDKIRRIDVSNVREVHPLAFANCRNISDVSLTITPNMLNNDLKLYSLFENDKTNFKKYTELTNIKVKVENGEIPEGFFEDCINVQKIEIVGEVSRIGAYAFKNCQNLKELIINFDGHTIEEEAFYGCRKLLELPSFKNVEFIENSAFTACNSLTSLEFGTIKEFGKNVFQDCSSLTSIDIVFGIDLLPEYTFSGCYSLRKYDFLNKIKRIGAYALAKMTFDNKFSIPSSVKGIQTNAFDNCVFEGVLTIPKNCQINTSAFSNINKIETIIYKNLEIKDLNDVKILPHMIFEEKIEIFNQNFQQLVNLQLDTDKIEEGAFKGWKNIVEAQINGKFSEIPSSCFEDCFKLEKVTVNSDKFQIKANAFANCMSLSELKTNKTKAEFNEMKIVDLSFAAKVEANAFNKCMSIEKVCLTITEQNVASQFKLHSIFEEVKEDIEGKYTKLDTVILNLETGVVPNYFFDACENIANVRIDGNLEELSEGFFRNCTKLTNLEMNYVGSVIPKECFKNCTSLTNLTLFSYVDQICDEAFYGCASLLEIQVECEVVTLGKSSFENCTSLKKVDFVFKGEVLPERCFNNCNEVMSFRFLNNIRKIQSYALSNITFTEDFAVPAKLDYIESYAFANSTFLDTIVLPNAKNINHLAFVDVKGFDKIEFHNLKLKDTNDVEILPYKIFTDTLREFNEKYSNVTTIIIKTANIIDDAFKDFVAIKNVVISPAVKVLPNSCFEGCLSLERIKLPYYDIALGNKVFTNCQNLIDVSFTEFDTKVKTDNFVPLGTYNNCTKLESISISIDQTVLSSGLKLYSFFEDNLEDFNVKYKKLNSIRIRSRVQEIPESFFEGCINVEKIVILDEIASLNKNVFANCSNLQELKMKFIGDVIPQACFLGCERLPNITNLKSVKVIEEQAFERCFSITAIQFRTPIEYLGAKAFNQCVNLEKINMYYIGEKLPTLCFGNCEALLVTPRLLKIVYADNSAFEGCINIDNVHINAIEGANFSNIFGSSKRITKINFTSNYIPARFFSDLRGVDELIFEQRIISIGDNAFDGMKGFTTLKNIESVESIGDYAFAHSDIETIKISNKTKFIGVGVFAGCEKLRHIAMPLHFMYAGSLFDSLNQNSTKKVTQEINNISKEFYIPESLETMIITSGELTEGVFSGMDINIHIDYEVTSIPAYTFNGCNNVSFAHPNKIKEINSYAFANSNIEDLDFQNVVTIADHAFYNTSLISLTIGNKLDSIEDTSLLDSIIEKLVVAETERYLLQNEMFVDIRKGTIVHVNNITGEVSIPDQVHTLNSNTFVNCTELTKVNTNKVKHIATNTFVNCENLVGLKLDLHAEVVEEAIFNKCSNVKYLHLDFLGRTKEEGKEVGYLFKDLVSDAVFNDITIVTGSICTEPFRNCSTISNLDLQKIELKTMDQGLFRNLKISTLTIPDTTEAIKENAFDKTFIENVVNKNNKKVKLVDNCIYVGTKLIYSYKEESSKITIPQNISSVYPTAFQIVNKIDLLEVDNDKIEFNNSLENVSVVESLSIGCISKKLHEVFKSSLNTIKKITYTAKEINDDFFNGLHNLYELNLPNIVELKNNCINNKDQLVISNVNIGSNLSNIDPELFRSCDVENIKVLNNQLYQTYDNMLVDNRKNAIIYSAININEDIVIDFNATVIEEKAFYNAHKLLSINTGKITAINNKAFNGCSNLRNIVVTNNCSTFGEDIFKNCNKIDSLSVPFVGANKNELSNITYLIDIERDNVLSLVNITNQEVISGTFSFAKNIAKIALSDTTTTIKSHSFNSLVELKEVNIPKTIKVVEEFMFINCRRRLNVHVYSKKMAETWPKNWRKVRDKKLFARCKVTYAVEEA